MLKNLLLSTFLSLKAHKLRVFLTMVGIIIGITAVVTVSFKDSLNSIHKENFELSIKKNGDTWFVKTLNHGVSQVYFKEEKEK